MTSPMSITFKTSILLSCIAIIISFSGCEETQPDSPDYKRDYKQDMKDLIMAVSNDARETEKKFVVVPQNGEMLTTLNFKLGGYPDTEFLETINGLGRDRLFYGYHGMDLLTPPWVYENIIFFLQKAMIYKKVILVTDFCSTKENIDQSYLTNSYYSFISSASPTFELDRIPPYPSEPNNGNHDDIDSLLLVKNYVYIRDPGILWTSKGNFIESILGTNFDLLITSLYFHDEPFSYSEVQALKIKACGNKRLVLACLPIGAAENDRYYWQAGWSTSPPDWLGEENPDMPGSYSVEYWSPEWQEVIFSNEDSYIDRILQAGFDGIYLEGADAFEYFEKMDEE